jgi:hypothetical protein
MARVLIAALLLTTGCAGNPAGPVVSTPWEGQVRAGHSVAIPGADLGLLFEIVASDSRCPADAICVTMGDAVAVFSVTLGGRAAERVSLHTQPGDGQRRRVGDWDLTLVRLEPYPYLGRPIQPSDYEATVRVERAEE